MKKRIIAMVLSVAMMLTMFPTGVLAEDFDLVESTESITEIAEEDQTTEPAASASQAAEPEESASQTTDPAASASQATEPVESESQTTEPAASASQETQPVESESQTADPAASASQETQPVESASQAADPAASSSQAAEPVESESQTTEPAASASQETQPVESASQTTEPAASASQAADPEEKDNSVITADLYGLQPTANNARNIEIEDGDKVTLKVGETVTLTSDGENKRWYYHDWTSSNEQVATVQGKGLEATVTGEGGGTAKITHRFYTKSGVEKTKYTETIDITVTARVNATLAAIRVEGAESPITSLELPKYEMRQLEAVFTPANAEYKSCAWSVNDESVLKVNPETGKITAKSVGTATVTLTVTNYDNTTVMTTLPVTVTNPVPPTSATIQVGGKDAESASVMKGKTIDLTAKILPENAQGYTCTWESNDLSRATVTPVAGDATNAKATVTGVEPTGETPVEITLTVTPEGAGDAASAGEAANGTIVTTTIRITVTDLPKVTEVAINGAHKVTQFQTIQLTPKIVQQVGAEDYTCEWSSDNSEILSVNENGVVTGKRRGTATVTLTVTNSDGTTAWATKSIEVVKNENPDESNQREAAIFCLIDPTKSANSNEPDDWTPAAGAKGQVTSSLGNATVNIEGWGNAKNCTDNVDQRVISWPSNGNQIDKNSNSAVWNTIVNNYMDQVGRELGVRISAEDVESITLLPFKLSQGNNTTTDIHLDCKVDIKCKNVYTATYKVMDAGSKEYRDLGGKNYKSGSATQPSDVTSETFEPTKTVDGVTYTFSGWYLDRGYHIPVQFPYRLTQNTTFYAKYEPGYNVTYNLGEGATWNGGATSEPVIAGRTHVVKGMSEATQPTRPGYTFAGWTVTGLDDVSEYNYPADQQASFKMPGNNVTLTAKWDKDETQTQPTEYTVQHVVAGEVKDTETYTGTAWINDNAPTITVKAGSLAQKTYTGYKYDSMSPETSEGDAVASGTVISLKYVKDDAQTKETKYTVQHVVAGEVKDTETYTGTAWINDNAPTITVKAGSLAQKTYTGYKYDSMSPETKEGDAVASGTVIKLKYVNRTDLSYKVHYYWKGTTDKVAPSKNVPDQTFGDLVTEKPIKVDGYTAVNPEEETQFSIGVTNEDVIFYYYKNVTVTADNKSKTYGADDPELTATATTVTGSVSKDTVKYALNRQAGKDVGTYAITPSGEAIQGNYMVTYMPGTLTINPLEGVVVTIKGHADTATYDGKPHSVDGYDIVSISNDLYHATDFVADENKGVSVSGTDAETYQMDLKPERFKNTNKNFANVKFVVEEDGKLVITPATLKITTNSAEKTYDESALTAGGKIEGVVVRDKDEVKLNITGSQTEVGSSQNTYEIEWGTAKETNYKITEDIGTLKVNARSGGGSSSKPTPEEEPTPTPTPTPLPTLPTTPAPTTPARRVTRSTATVTEPASRPTEQITENETPKAESEPEVIEDEETPLAPMATGAWALVNLILMLLTVLASLLLLLGYLGKKKHAKEDEYGNALHDANGNEIIDYTRNKKGFWRVASLIPAIAAVIAFALTENMRLPMVMTDRWTLLMVIIAVVQLIVAVLCKKKKESEEDENQANA